MRLYRKRLVSHDALSDEDEDEDVPLLLNGDAILKPRSDARGQCCSMTALYFLVMVVNGALIGALGPSLEPIGRAVGVQDAVLARYVLFNRLCKLAGTLVWCAYARKLQQPFGVAHPHATFAGLMLVTAASAIALGAATRAISVQVALLAWGVAYGITDSGVNSASPKVKRAHARSAHVLIAACIMRVCWIVDTALTVWRWSHDNRRRRIDVALLNAGFTVGALLGPSLVVASLRYGGGRWAFHAISGLALITCAYLAIQPPMSLPVRAAHRTRSPTALYAT